MAIPPGGYPQSPNYSNPTYTGNTSVPGPMFNPYGGQYTVGGGQIQAEQELQAAELAQRMEMARMQLGQGVMGYLTDLQRDPFSIVPALQAYSASGGGTLAPNAAMVQSGGLGQPSPYGDIVGNLIRGLSEFAGGANINPVTGRPYTPNELAEQRRQPQAKPIRKGTKKTGTWKAKAAPKVSETSSISRMPAKPRGIGDIFRGLTPDQVNSMLDGRVESIFERLRGL